MPDAECRVQTSPGSAAGDPPQLKPNSATLCPREHKSEFWKETDGTKTGLLLGEEAGVITDLRLDLLHCFDFYLTWFTFFSTIDKKAVLLGSSGLRHGDSQRRSGDQGAGKVVPPQTVSRSCFRSAKMAEPLSPWWGLLPICRFNNGNMHFTNERINSREMVFLATVALCFKGVGFI